MRHSFFLVIAPVVLAIRDGHPKSPSSLQEDSETGTYTTMTMTAEVSKPANCFTFGGDNRVLKVIVEDTNVPSRYYHKFEKKFAMDSKLMNDKMLEEKLPDVPDSAKLRATVYVKQQNWWQLGWSKCGKLSAEIKFPYHSDVHIWPILKDGSFYQQVTLTFTKESKDKQKVIKIVPKSAPKPDSTFGRKIIDEDGTEEASTDGVETQGPTVQPQEPNTPPLPDQAEMNGKESDELDTDDVPMEKDELDKDPMDKDELDKDPMDKDELDKDDVAMDKDELDTDDVPTDKDELDKDDVPMDKDELDEPEPEVSIDEDSLEAGGQSAPTSEDGPVETAIVDTEEIAAEKSPEVACETCMERMGLGLEGLLAWTLNDMFPILCDFDDCNENCTAEWNGATIGCSKDKEFVKTMKRGVVTHAVAVAMAQRKALQGADKQELELAEKAKMKAAKEFTAEEDDGPSSEDPSVKAMKECQSGPKGGSWLKSELEAIVPAKGKRKKAQKKDLKKWLSGYCTKRKTTDANFQCVPLWTKIRVHPQGKVGCDFKTWMKKKVSGSWSKGCPFNGYKICDDEDKSCKGTHWTWASCLAKMK